MNQLTFVNSFSQTVAAALPQNIEVPLKNLNGKVVAIVAAVFIALSLLALAIFQWCKKANELTKSEFTDAPKSVEERMKEVAHEMVKKTLEEVKKEATVEDKSQAMLPKEAPKLEPQQPVKTVEKLVAKHDVKFNLPSYMTAYPPAHFLKKAYNALLQLPVLDPSLVCLPIFETEINTLNGCMLQEDPESFRNVVNKLESLLLQYTLAHYKSGIPKTGGINYFAIHSQAMNHALQAVNACLAVVYYNCDDTPKFIECLNRSGNEAQSAIMLTVIRHMASENRLDASLLFLGHLSLSDKDRFYFEIAHLCCDKHQYGTALDIIKGLTYSQRQDEEFLKIAKLYFDEMKYGEAYEAAMLAADGKPRQDFVSQVVDEYCAKGQLEEALKIVLKQPMQATALLKIAHLYVQRNDLKTARAIAEKLVGTQKTQLLYKITDAHCQNKEFDEAFTIVKAQETSPEKEQHLKKIIDLWLQNNKPKKALEVSQALLQPEQQKQYALKVAEAHCQNKEFDEAFAIVKDQSVCPDRERLLIQIIDLCLQHKKLKLALDAARELNNNEPKQQLLMKVAKAYHQAGASTAAIDILERYVSYCQSQQELLREIHINKTGDKI